LRLDGKKRRERQKVGTKVREETRSFLGESQGWEHRLHASRACHPTSKTPPDVLPRFWRPSLLNADVLSFNEPFK
jgi:hypothetical protein